MYLVASVRPSVRPSVCPSVRPSVRPLTAEPFDLGFAECSKEQRRVIISPPSLSVCRIVARMRSIRFYSWSGGGGSDSSEIIIISKVNYIYVFITLNERVDMDCPWLLLTV